MATPNKTKKSKKREREANKIQKLLHDKRVEEKRLRLFSQLYERKVPTLTSICLQFLTRYTIKKPKQRRIQLLSLKNSKVVYDHHIPHSSSSSSLSSSLYSSLSSSLDEINLSSSQQSLSSSTPGLNLSFTSSHQSLASSTSSTQSLSSSTPGLNLSFTSSNSLLDLRVSSTSTTQSLSASSAGLNLSFPSSAPSSTPFSTSSSSISLLDLHISTESTNSSSTTSSEEVGEREKEDFGNPFFYPSPTRSKHNNNNNNHSTNSNNNNNNNNYNSKNNKKGTSPRSQHSQNAQNYQNSQNSNPITPPKMFTSQEDLKTDLPLESTFYYQIPTSLQEAFQRVTLEEHLRRFMLKLVGEYLKEVEEALSADPSREKDALRLAEIYLSLLPYPEECRKNFAKRFAHVSKVFDLALAYVYWMRGEVALADQQFRACLALSQVPNQTSLPSSAHLCREAARLHYHFGGYDFAREYYEEAEHHNPALQDLTLGEIACLAQDRENGDLEEAASLWRSIIERTSEEEDFVFPNLDSDELTNNVNPKSMQIRTFERMVDCYVRLGRFDGLFELLQQADTFTHHQADVAGEDDDGVPHTDFVQTKYYMCYTKALACEFAHSREIWAKYWAREYPFTFLQAHNEFARVPILSIVWEFNYGHAEMGATKRRPDAPPKGRVSPKDPALYEFIDDFEFPGRLCLCLDKSGKCVSPPHTLQLRDTIFRQQLYAPFPYVLFDNSCALCYAIQNMTFCYIFRSLYGTNPPIIEQIDFTEAIFKKIRRGSVRESPPPKKTNKELKEEKKMKRFLKKVMPEAAPPSTENRHKFQIVDCATVGECVVVVGYDFGAPQIHVMAVLHPTMDQIVGYTLMSVGKEHFHFHQKDQTECIIVSCFNDSEMSKYIVVNSQGNVATFQDTVITLFYMNGYVYSLTPSELVQFTTSMEPLMAVDVLLIGFTPMLRRWNKGSDLLAVLCGKTLLVYDSTLEERLKMDFQHVLLDGSLRVLSSSETRTLVYASGKLYLFEGVELLCSVDEDHSFQGVLAGHCVSKGFVVFGSSSLADLVTLFLFDDKGILKGIYPNLIPGTGNESFVDEDGRILVAESDGRILCISLDCV
eukprot:Phypoly_transcript_01323.p1 GENE.Phypoly_transcript_01323~~Phypoly_transcript_01323.p1  ORF type:complete len:1098 (+),score=246.37 Phypoly_transcript_01323:81-3374(+)